MGIFLYKIDLLQGSEQKTSRVNKVFLMFEFCKIHILIVCMCKRIRLYMDEYPPWITLVTPAPPPLLHRLPPSQTLNLKKHNAEN